MVEGLLKRGLSGLVLAPITADQSYLSVWSTRLPVVFVDRAPRGLSGVYVIEDDLAGARAAVLHLASHGHRRVAFIFSRETSQPPLPDGTSTASLNCCRLLILPEKISNSREWRIIALRGWSTDSACSVVWSGKWISRTGRSSNWPSLDACSSAGVQLGALRYQGARQE